MLLQIHSIVKKSASNGPGLRYAIWFQGCTLTCPGCFNPETHANDTGIKMDTKAIVEDIVRQQATIEGITISGGEPFQQPAGLLSLLLKVRENTNLSTLIFTGYSLAELELIPESNQILALTDILISGRYNSAFYSTQPLLGSSNQQIHFLTSRYKPHDLLSVPDAEILIDGEGQLIITGTLRLKPL